MKYCSACGEEISANSSFCSNCGAALTTANSENQASSIHTNNPPGNNANTYLTIGWISCAVSLFFIPVLFGALTVIMGYLTRKTKEQHGTIMMVAGIAAGILGMLLGFVVGGSYYYY